METVKLEAVYSKDATDAGVKALLNKNIPVVKIVKEEGNVTIDQLIKNIRETEEYVKMLRNTRINMLKKHEDNEYSKTLLGRYKNDLNILKECGKDFDVTKDREIKFGYISNIFKKGESKILNDLYSQFSGSCSLKIDQNKMEETIDKKIVQINFIIKRHELLLEHLAKAMTVREINTNKLKTTLKKLSANGKSGKQ